MQLEIFKDRMEQLIKQVSLFMEKLLVFLKRLFFIYSWYKLTTFLIDVYSSTSLILKDVKEIASGLNFIGSTISTKLKEVSISAPEFIRAIFSTAFLLMLALGLYPVAILIFAGFVAQSAQLNSYKNSLLFD